MDTYDILSLPQVAFAHIYKSETHNYHFLSKNNFLEICYIAEGSLNIEIGNDKTHAKKGDVLCMFRNADTIVSTNEFHCHHTVAATIQWTPANDEMNNLLLPVLTPAEYDTSRIFHVIESFISKQTLYITSNSKGAAKFLELLCEIDKCNRKAQNINLPSEIMYAQRAKNYIQKNIYDPITQNAVAEHLGISPGYLCSIFKTAEGTTLMRYINKIKLENIKTLMDHENIHLYEAAAIYGYSDPNYVSRLFKQFFGYNITDAPYMHPQSKK